MDISRAYEFALVMCQLKVRRLRNCGSRANSFSAFHPAHGRVILMPLPRLCGNGAWRIRMTKERLRAWAIGSVIVLVLLILLLRGCTV